MRILAATALLVGAGCASPAQPDARQAGGNDCAIVVALAKEHYKFGADNPPLPLKASSEDGWAPKCDWAKHGLAFTPYDPNKPGDPRERLRYVEFQKPAYDGGGATINTSIMHGPLAGMGYSCQMRSGFAGWTVENCRTAWVS